MSVRIEENLKKFGLKDQKIGSQIVWENDKRNFGNSFSELRFHFCVILWIFFMNVVETCTKLPLRIFETNTILAQRRNGSFSSVIGRFLGYFFLFLRQLNEAFLSFTNSNLVSLQLRNFKAGLGSNQLILNCSNVTLSWNKWGSSVILWSFV